MAVCFHARASTLKITEGWDSSKTHSSVFSQKPRDPTATNPRDFPARCTARHHLKAIRLELGRGGFITFHSPKGEGYRSVPHSVLQIGQLQDFKEQKKDGVMEQLAEKALEMIYEALRFKALAEFSIKTIMTSLSLYDTI